MRLLRALHAMKPPMPEGMIAASDPPASIKSASPRRMWSAALRGVGGWRWVGGWVGGWVRVCGGG